MSPSSIDPQHIAEHALLDERLHRVEDRIEATEKLAMRVPAIEARIGRMEKLMLELQGDFRRLERTQHAALEVLGAKMDKLLDLLQPKVTVGP